MEPGPIDRRALPPGATLSRWAAADGWPHRRMDWLQRPGSEVRGSLLFASGRGDFIEKYVEAYHHWHGRGWDVTAFDWRTQGGSRGDVEGGHLDDFEPLVGDLEALVGEWSESASGPRVAVAHSMGGHFLLRLLAERRPPLAAAVLVAPMLGINTAPMPDSVAQWLAGFMTVIGWGRQPAWQQRTPPPPAGSFRQSILTSCRERYEDELWWWEKEPGYNLGGPSWGWLQAAYRSCDRLTPERLREVSIPVLLLGTDRDRLVSAEAIRRAARLIPGAELMMFAGAGHEILREADPVRLAAFERIDSFLDARAPR